MAVRMPCRLAACQFRQMSSRRTFATTSHLLKAQNFTMPAMSPTMTEGNISSWKVKEGDSFSTGDVLLEIETDKAVMDVEAQEDGIMAKIVQVDGAKGIQVGSRIAVLAEPGDDIGSLDISSEDVGAAPNRGSKEEKSKPGPSEASDASASKKSGPSKPTSTSTSPSGPGQNTKYPLYPAVSAIIHENHISESDISKIPATGPNGRLLKGDVLSYLGRIQADYSSMQSKRIRDLGHMDLSNIKIAPPTTKGAEREANIPASAQVPETTPEKVSIAVPISLNEVLKVQKRVKDTLGTTMTLSAFLARAVDLANNDLPRPKDVRASSTELFNAVLGLDSIPKTSRGSYLPQITALPDTSSSFTAPTAAPTTTRATLTTQLRTKPPDIIDILIGAPPPRNPYQTKRTTNATPATTTPTGLATNMFSITVPAGEERRARTFLERMKTILQVEPGKLIL